MVPIYKEDVHKETVMDLSAIINEYNLPLTRSESNLVAQLSTTGTSAVSNDLYKRRMKALAAARNASKQLPDRQTLERQDKMDKAGLLSQRLKMLRQMIPFMSPSAVRSLTAEMKQIAAQLASLGNASGGGNGGVVSSLPAAAVGETPGSGSNVESVAETVQVNGLSNDNGGTRQENRASSDSALQVDGVKSGDSSAEDRQLKEAVEELKNQYRAVLAALKRKLQSGSGQLSGHMSHLRVYAGMPDGTGSVTIKA
jgi:hypothetical protein